MQLVMVTPRPVTHHCTACPDREDAHIQCRQSFSVPPHLCPLSSYTQYTIPPVEWILYISHIWCGIPDQTCALSRHHNHSFILICVPSPGLGWTGLYVSCWLRLCSTALTLRYPGQRAVTVIISSQREALRNN